MKRCWIDVETGGLDPKVNPILQIAILVEDEKGKVVEEYASYIKPHASVGVIEPEALAINGITHEIIATAPNEYAVLRKITQILGKGQYEFCGYNSRFDMDFVVALFGRHKEFKYWSHFNYYDVDVFALVKILGITGTRFDEKKNKNVPCKKLECVCEMFGIKLKAHDAIEDIKATRKLYKKLTKKYLK